MKDRADVPLDLIRGTFESQRFYANIYQLIIGSIGNIGRVHTLLDGSGRCEGFRFQSQSEADVESPSWIELRISYKRNTRGLVIVTLSDGINHGIPVGAEQLSDDSGDYYFYQLVYVYELQGLIDFIYGRM